MLMIAKHIQIAVILRGHVYVYGFRRVVSEYWGSINRAILECRILGYLAPLDLPVSSISAHLFSFPFAKPIDCDGPMRQREREGGEGGVGIDISNPPAFLLSPPPHLKSHQVFSKLSMPYPFFHLYVLHHPPTVPAWQVFQISAMASRIWLSLQSLVPPQLQTYTLDVFQ